MNVITTLKERQREKQVKYERRLLRDLSIENMKKRVVEHFGSDKSIGIYFSDVLEEGCFDIAIEAFLLGARFSKFGYYGESEEMARSRCAQEEKHLIDTLFNFILYWGKVGDIDLYSEDLYYRCTAYVEVWWKDGFGKGEKRYKMRLH
ncbi:YbaK family protein [Actinomycetes bacterium NPDC127524]